jgi:hypothetical protein
MRKYGAICSQSLAITKSLQISSIKRLAQETEESQTKEPGISSGVPPFLLCQTHCRIPLASLNPLTMPIRPSAPRRRSASPSVGTGRASSTFSTGSLMRALSPALAGIAEAVPGEDSQVRLVQAARSFEDLLACVPVRYREVVSPIIRDIMDIADKAESTARQMRRLQADRAAGTLPPQIAGSVKIPSLQLVQRFLAEAPEKVREYEAEMRAYRTSAYEGFLSQGISVLDEQLSFLREKITPTVCEARITSAAATETDSLAARFPIYRTVTRVSAEPEGAQRQISQLDVEGTRARYAPVMASFRLSVPAIVDAAFGIATARYQRQDASSAAKKVLRERAQNAMARPVAGPSTGAAPSSDMDVDPPVAGPSTGDLRTLVQKELQKALKTGKVSASPFVSSMNSDLTLHSGGEIRKRKGKVACPAESGQEFLHPTGREEGRQREEARRIIGRVRNFDFFDYESYPDKLLTLSPEIVVEVLITYAPDWFVSAQRYRNTIHIQAGIELPELMARDLAVGMRFIPPIKMKENLLKKSYSDFIERTRWHVFFTLNPKEEIGELGYVPEFETPKALERQKAPLAPLAIENGFSEGQALVDSFIPAIPDQTTRQNRKMAPPLNSVIQEYVISNGLIITQTDKNLGLAAIKESWYMEHTYKLLYNRNDYNEITFEVAYNKLFYSAAVARDLLQGWYSLPGFSKEKQLGKFLENSFDKLVNIDGYLEPINDELAAHERQCDEVGVSPAIIRGTNPLSALLDEWSKRMPLFHAIPKIHKNPWKMRPIMPCHSTILANFSKVLSILLKAVLAERPYVLEGSKALCRDLKKVDLSGSADGKKIFIVTGDIVAYYPNVPVQDAKIVIKTMWQKYTDNNYVPLVYTEIFDELLMLATDMPPVCQFTDKYFEQRKGLAMGMHCSPDLANLYAAKFEEEFMDNNTDVIFYRRFIDDLLIVCRAENEAAALEIAGGLVIDGCEIGWEASRWSAAFLDIYVYYDPVSNTLEHKPYLKALNHRERLPWISNHPLTVKRGTFVGEISRLAVLCSKERHFNDACVDLANLYRARGYPDRVLHSWLNNNQSQRWLSKWNIESQHAPPMVLKSEFNPVWDSFPIRELEEIIKNCWSQIDTSQLRKRKRPSRANPMRNVRANRGEIAGASSQSSSGVLERETEVVDAETIDNFNNLISRRLFVSKKRTRNMFDIINTWKKALIYDPIRDFRNFKYIGRESEGTDDP